MKNNPFSYGKTVDEPYFYGREREVEEIRISMQNATNMILYAPRRIGKSSLVIKVLRELEAAGHPVVYIDLFKVSSREKLIELYAREVVRGMKSWEKGLQWIQGVIRGVEPALGLDHAGMPELRLSIDPLQSARAFEDILNIPARSKREKCWVVVFDEFQEIEKLGGEAFEKELRANLQHHKNAAYLFLGSQRHMLLNMFSRKERAFYNFGKLYHLEKPSATDSMTFVTRRFAAGGYVIDASLAQQMVEQTRNIPYYLQYLGAEIWEIAQLSAKKPAEVYAAALDRLLINQGDYFQGIRGQLTPFQMKLLTAVAINGTGSYESEFLQKFRLFPPSSVQKAYSRMIDLDILEKQANKFCLTDPFFEMWLKRQS
jgi:uncharacterized protein